MNASWFDYTKKTPNEDLLTILNRSFAISMVGKNEKFHILSDDESLHYFTAIKKHLGTASSGDGGSAYTGGNKPVVVHLGHR